MTAPEAFGRSVVIDPDAHVPEPWKGASVVLVDDATLDEPEATIDRLHRAWSGREAIVIELGVDPTALRVPETEDRDPHEVGATFVFPLERLHFLVWANSYDARSGVPKWWWSVKAAAIGATEAGPADVVLPGGIPAWIDGGPRGLIKTSEAVVHAETVALGRLDPAPACDPVDGRLARDQAAAANHSSGPARIIAPAGSGKTRTLTARLRHLLDDRAIEPNTVCALAYNTKAAAELRERAGATNGALVRTVHSLGWEILREARNGVRLIDERDVRAILDRVVQAPRRPNTDTIGPYVEALAETRIALRSPTAVEAGRDDVPDFAAVYERYRQRLVRGNEADFDEQVHGAIKALLADPDLRRRWQDRCRHVLVDEFQDLTGAYLLLIRLLASPQLDVFGVGDDDQTIYGYAGADPGYLIDYDRIFPGAASHPLEVNYRCPVPVVTAATNLLSYNARRIEKTITAAVDAVDRPDAFTVDRVDGEQLGVAAADRIERWLAETGPSDVAVLARVNSALLPVHVALAESGVPFSSPIGRGMLTRTVVSATLAWMRLGLDPERMARTDLMTAVRRPSRGLNRLATDLIGGRRFYDLGAVVTAGADLSGKQAQRWDGFAEDLERVAIAAEQDDAAALLDVVIRRVGLESSALALDSGRSRADRSAQSDDLVALRRAAAIHPTASDFETWLAEMIDRSGPGGVTLSTVHRAKGLEWDRVVVFGVDRGLLPHDLATDLEEERRILHVAITRGIQQVTILSDIDRPSRFLDELTGAASRTIEPEPIRRKKRPEKKTRRVGAEVGDTVTARGGISGVVADVDADGIWVEVEGGGQVQVHWGDEIKVEDRKGPLTPVPEMITPDADLVERLKAWRLETARATGMPAYVILHDATIETIAGIRPQTETQLASVPGIGPAKLEAHGDAILEICAD
ncbi:MAG: UvrD-helicase domain-containing protein [Actinomycetota bacterium]|nr:UvrD-helicase domain-containing protein [Actinomycetota bacterium]